MNYFVDPDEAMRAMAGALVPGGRLIVSSINAAHPTERGYVAPAGHHRTLFDPKSLADLAAEADLRVDSIRGIRILADRLPVAWNRPGAGRIRSAALSAVLAIEPLLQRVADPGQAKFLWLVATRP